MGPRLLPARCAEHGLAPGPDGHCVLCRRAATESASGGWRERVVVIAAVGLGLAVVVAVAGRLALSPASSPPPAVAEPVVTAESAPTAPQRVDRRPARVEVVEAPSAVEAKPRAPASAVSASAASASARAEELRARSEADLEKRRELAAAMHRVPITLYTTPWCAACARAKTWLVANRYAYRELDVEHDANARRTHRELNPRGSVPTIDVDGDVMVGFSAPGLESSIRHAAERRAF